MKLFWLFYLIAVLKYNICKCNSCNMGMRDLPDMYTRSPRAAANNNQKASGVKIVSRSQTACSTDPQILGIICSGSCNKAC